MKLIKLPKVMDMTALSRSSVYKYMEKGLFPKPVTHIGKSVAWVESEIQNWILEKIKERDGND